MNPEMYAAILAAILGHSQGQLGPSEQPLQQAQYGYGERYYPPGSRRNPDPDRPNTSNIPMTKQPYWRQGSDIPKQYPRAPDNYQPLPDEMPPIDPRYRGR